MLFLQVFRATTPTPATHPTLPHASQSPIALGWVLRLRIEECEAHTVELDRGQYEQASMGVMEQLTAGSFGTTTATVARKLTMNRTRSYLV